MVGVYSYRVLVGVEPDAVYGLERHLRGGQVSAGTSYRVLAGR